MSDIEELEYRESANEETPIFSNNLHVIKSGREGARRMVNKGVRNKNAPTVVIAQAKTQRTSTPLRTSKCAPKDIFDESNFLFLSVVIRLLIVLFSG